MNNRSGLSFADVLILIALVLLLAALAIPRFVKAPDYGNEQDEAVTETTNHPPAAESASPSKAPGSLPQDAGEKRSLLQP
jgi:hypothetical protein